MRSTHLRLLAFAAPAIAVILASSSPIPVNGWNHGSVCNQAASAVRQASINEAKDDFWIGIANCLNMTDPEDAAECYVDNFVEWWAAVSLAGEQYDARRDFCQLYGGGAYDPEIDPDNFSNVVTNPLFPLHVGETKVYHEMTDEGLGVVEETVLAETREIAGVECACVQFFEYLDGVLLEDTKDYYAQDDEGNVWYFGESVLNYDEETGVVDTEGQWFADIDGAKPGIIMLAAPQSGDIYRQELLWNDAEDVASVTDLDNEVSVPAGNYVGCAETLDWTPIEPGIFEAKFYAPGVGLVLEVDLESGQRVELVSVTP